MTMAFTLGQQMARTLAIFQGLLALPIVLFMLGFAVESLFYNEPRVYEFM